MIDVECRAQSPVGALYDRKKNFEVDGLISTWDISSIGMWIFGVFRWDPFIRCWQGWQVYETLIVHL